MDDLVDIDALLGDLELESDGSNQQTTNAKTLSLWSHQGTDFQHASNAPSSENLATSNGFGTQTNGNPFQISYDF